MQTEVDQLSEVVPTLTDREGFNEYKAPRVQLSLADFDLERRLGEGSYAQVVQVRQKSNGAQYALKVVDKNLVLKNKYTAYIKSERMLLDRLDSPWIVNLHFTFQDQYSLYFVLELCQNGELHDQLQRKGKLSTEEARFYAAEIVEILEYLRDQKVVHRDLKPENILLDQQGHLKLIDFGSAKEMDGERSLEQPPDAASSPLQHSQRSTSMVGTAEYLPPEVLRNEAIGYAADLWALGCLLYRMLVGCTPFAAASEYLIFERITSHDLQIPDTIPAAARDLLTQLLEDESAKRIGAGGKGLVEIKEHDFFSGTPWHSLRKQQAPPVAQADRVDSDGIDWEWSSLASALPVYVSSGAQGSDATAKGAPGPERARSGESQHPSDLSERAADSAPQSKGSTRQQSGPADSSSAGRQGPQQGSPAAPGPAAPGAAPGRTRSLKASPAPAQPSTAAPRPPSIASPRAPEHPAELSSSPGKGSSNPLSPKLDPHKPPAAGAPSAGGHHKGSSPRTMPKAPSRKGDFLGQNASPASLQSAWSAGSGGRDDRMDQAASVMLANQFYADAQSGGRN